jgi:MSHA pilin protein MshA
MLGIHNCFLNTINEDTKMKTQQSGFTLIELVVVIVILGILAAIAVPKFVDLGSDARTSIVKALAGSMHDTNTMIYSKAVAAAAATSPPTSLATLASVTINTQPVPLAFGFAATATDLVKVMDLSPELVVDSTGLIIEHNGANTVGATCGVTYTAATALKPSPTYLVGTGGC